MGTGRPRRQKRKGSAQTRRPRGFFLLLALLFALTAAAIVLTAAELSAALGHGTALRAGRGAASGGCRSGAFLSPCPLTKGRG